MDQTVLERTVLALAGVRTPHTEYETVAQNPLLFGPSLFILYGVRISSRKITPFLYESFRNLR